MTHKKPPRSHERSGLHLENRPRFGNSLVAGTDRTGQSAVVHAVFFMPQGIPRLYALGENL